MASLTLQQVACIFRTRRQQVRALHDFSLEVNDRELVVLVGPSGCGKTTVLRLIAGLEQPAAGIIQIDGRDVRAVAPKDRDVAMVFQDYALYPHMSVFQNMAFGLKMRGASSSHIAEAVAAAARKLELTDVLERTPAQLSGGQKQRVALGRAIVRKPQVFLLDEPLSNLDTQLRAAARTQIKTLQRELSTTMIYVTHDQEEAMTLADRIAVMRGGLLQQFGTPAEIYDRPANRFVAEFFGSPPMNLIPGALQSTGGKPFFNAEGLSIELSSATVPPQLSSVTTQPELESVVVPPPLAGSKTRSGEGATAGRDSNDFPPRILLGIRPTDVEISPGPAPASQWIAARIQSVEYLGDSMNLIVLPGNNIQITAKTKVDRSWTPGQNVHLRFPPDRLHLFDADAAGARLSP